MVEILIQRSLPIVNGFVQIPHSEFKKTRLSPAVAEMVIPGSDAVKAGQVTRQQALRLPAFNRMDGYPQDWDAVLNSI